MRCASTNKRTLQAINIEAMEFLVRLAKMLDGGAEPREVPGALAPDCRLSELFDGRSCDIHFLRIDAADFLEVDALGASEAHAESPRSRLNAIFPVR